jgi:hypothetical protein
VSVVYNEVRHEMAREGETGDAEHFDREVLAELPMLPGVPRDKWDTQCVRTKRPESLKELIALFGQRAVAQWRRTATGPTARRVPGSPGTLLTLTGESTFGAASYTGVGAYYSCDLGKTWTRSAGIPDGALGFAVAVGPADANKMYAATQLGRFASVGGGRTYKNANFPTGECSGVTDVDARPECALQNVVTDVVVVTSGGVNTTTKSGTVVATVGWRGGQRQNPEAQHRGRLRHRQRRVELGRFGVDQAGDVLRS